MSAVDWAESHWIVPETGRLIVLKEWQRQVLRAMFPDGSASPWETFLISTVKKAGKTTLDALATLYAVLTFPPGEVAFCVANDLAQAQERDAVSRSPADTCTGSLITTPHVAASRDLDAPG